VIEGPRIEARREAAAARDLLEQVLLDLPLLPARVDRAPIAGLIERSLAALDALAETVIEDAPHLDHLASARATAGAARALLALAAAGDASARSIDRLAALERSLTAYERRAQDRLAAMEDRYLRAPIVEAPAALPPFRASLGVPALHHLARPALPPRLRIEALDEDDDDEDDDDDDASPRVMGASEPDDPAGAWRIQLRRIARDALEEIGALGGLRRAEGDDEWSPALGRFEQRMLADLDALAALGQKATLEGGRELVLDVPAEALAYAADAFTADTVRPFARAFVLGCIAGEDTARAAVLALRQSHPLTHDAQRSALALASNPALGGALRALAQHDDPALAGLALDALRARGEATLDVAAALAAHPDPAVRRRAARCLGAVPERAPAIALLDRLLRDEPDDRVAAAAAESLLPLDLDAGLALVRRRLEQASHPDLLVLLAIAGGPRDAALLAARLERSPAAAEALGWHGHPGHVDVLLDALERAANASPDDPFRVATLSAIRRITGAPPGLTLEGLRAFWDQQRGDLGAPRAPASAEPRKLRSGRPYTPLASLDELSADDVPGRVRALLALEVAIITGGPRLDVDGWVAVQLATIARLRDQVAAIDPPHRPGAWPASRDRLRPEQDKLTVS
jgi:hypothetical protein